MNSDQIQLTLSHAEFEQLLQLVYLGEWMANAYKKGNEPIDFETIEQNIYAKAFDMGFEDVVEYENEIGAFIPTTEFEEQNQSYIDEYDEQTFKDELASYFAQVDIENQPEMSQKEFEAKSQSLFEKYSEFFENDGLEKLKLDI